MALCLPAEFPADDIDPDFAAWITQNWDVIRGKMEGRRPDWIAAAAPLLASGDTFGLNIPRAFYGDYMEQRVARVFADLRAKDVTINFVAETAVSIAEVDSAITITTDSGAEYTADYVDIAPGGPSTQRLQGDDGPFSAPRLFGNEARIAEHIKAGAEIFCVGSNATMLDALRLCQSVVAEDKFRFVACSSDGSIPAPLIPRMPRYLTQPKLKSGHKTAQDFLDDVWQAMQTARAAGDQMREIRGGSAPISSTIRYRLSYPTSTKPASCRAPCFIGSEAGRVTRSSIFNASWIKALRARSAGVSARLRRPRMARAF
ncbi:FAD/NAD(P)-binding protein [Rhodobacteraceae bacterium S2214]|nr:FAD/NAD(P)-binding protein [Rhodobacteraceae bacterium S2214]